MAFQAPAARFAAGPATMRHLVAVSRAQAPADLVLRGGAVVDVFSEEILEGWGVVVAGDRIAYVGPEADRHVGNARRVIELEGDLVAPGLIEGHTHLNRIGIAETASGQLRAGVTTTVVETLELAFLGGTELMAELVAEAEAQSARILFALSPLVCLDPVHDAWLGDAEPWIRWLEHPLVVAVGESYWQAVLSGGARTEGLIAAANRLGKAVDGHAAGARPAALAAYMALGVGSDHEGINAEDALNRLRLGLYTYARHGATRRDLSDIARLWNGKGRPALDRMALVTDGVEPDRLAAGESLNTVVEYAIELGLSPATAIRMASRTVAERIGLGRWLGGLGPAMMADLVVIPPDGRFRPRLVMVGGVEASGGVAHRWSDRWRQGVRLERLELADFRRPPAGGRYRAIRFTAPMVTREAESAGEGLLCTVFDRLHSDRRFTGLVLGYGLGGGAVACTATWDAPCLTVLGVDPVDMLAAAARVRELGGGAVVAAGGRVLAEAPAEICGMVSDRPAGEVAAEIVQVNRTLRELGCEFDNPLMSVEGLTTIAIPFLRITSTGYLDVRTSTWLPLTVSG